MDALGLTATQPGGAEVEVAAGAAPRTLSAGAKIGRYVVLDLLGEGAMGQVYTGFDVALDRKVAIKVIRAELVSTRAQERTLREAQALAQLSHPNVVQVYEVGEHRDQLFLAMEYVDGQNLRQWLRQEERPWRDTVALLIEVGRGLQAAHAIGLIHRDVKPDNILIGNDGRARIADFGLVRSVDSAAPKAGAADEPSAPGPGSSGTTRSGSGRAWTTEHLTQDGRAIGTPAYMPPEQHLGGEVDHRTDQFSLCASLYEALYGARPFSGHDAQSIRAQAIAGKVRPPPPNTDVPRWLDRALRRGLAPAPDERWPSMDALLHALNHDPSRRWRWAAAITLGLALLASSVYALASHQAQLANRCTGAAKELVGVWDEPREAELQRAFVETGTPLAVETIPRVERILDTYAERWTDLHRTTCEAHLSGATSPLLLDLTMECLRRRKGELAALVEVLLEGEEGTVENAVLAASNLPPLSACANAESLLTTTPPPEDPAKAQEVVALRGELGRALALEGAGRYDDGLRLMRELEPRVEVLAYPPLTAEMLLRHGSLDMWADSYATASERLHQAFVMGLGNKADRVAIEALAKWIYASGYGLSRSEETLQWGPTALALLDRLEDTNGLRALTLHNLATATSRDGRLREAIELESRALEYLDEAVENETSLTIGVLSNISESYLELRRCAESESASNKARSTADRVLSEGHPLTLLLELNHCGVHACHGRHMQARDCWASGLRLYEAQMPPSPMSTSIYLRSSGMLALDQGATDDARSDLSRSLSSFEPGDEPIFLGDVAESLGWLALAEDEPEEAKGYFVRSLAIHDRYGTRSAERLNLTAGLASLELTRGDIQGARERLEQALDEVQGVKDDQPWIYARARFTLARALATSPVLEDRRRARELALLARDSLTVGHFEDGLRAQVEAWLGGYDPEREPPPSAPTEADEPDP